MTYTICKKLIEIKDFDEGEKEDLQNKIDIFLLNNRVSDKEYEELVGLLNAKQII